jgi:hypothetical protein
MIQRTSGLVFLLGGLGLSVAACQASASAHVSASGEAQGNAEASGETSSAPAPAASAPADPPPAPASTPADACPLHCYVASGAYRTDVSADELAQIKSAVEPVLSRMRACIAADAWRAHGSPTLHLRVGPDGAVHDVDVDPHHAYDYERGCIDGAANGSSLNLALPGRKAVRCVERCQAVARTRRRR